MEKEESEAEMSKEAAFNVALGKALQGIRKEKGLTTFLAGSLIGVSSADFRQIEEVGLAMTPYQLLTFCQYTGHTVSYVIGLALSLK